MIKDDIVAIAVLTLSFWRMKTC